MNNINGHIYCIVKSCSFSFAIQLFLFCILPQAHAQTLKELIEIISVQLKIEQIQLVTVVSIIH